MSILTLDYLVFVLAVLVGYYLCPVKFRWMVLLAASGVFCAYSGWQGCAYLAGFACITWVGALLMGELLLGERKAAAKITLAVVLTILLGSMAFLKYAGGLFEKGLLIPLGLSWFTFQGAAYLIEVQRGKVLPEKNPLKVLLFLSFFPQLVQGPVSDWKQLYPQLANGNRLSPKGMASGLTLMLWGFFKKLVLADRLALVTAYAVQSEVVPGWLILISAPVYMLQLYADFSGGMDIIRGTAEMMGIDMRENFRRPFFALSVSDYWRRWHISLGAWFRTYLLYPLTTSQFGLWLSRISVKFIGKKAGRLVPSALSTVIIFLLIGLWHGASWNAAIYGIYFGLIMVVSMFMEPLFKKLRKKMGPWDKGVFLKSLRLVRTWLLVAFAQFFAFTAGTQQTVSLLGGIFGNWSVSFSETMNGIMAPLEWAIALGALVMVTVVDVLNEKGEALSKRIGKTSFLVRWPVLLVLILLIIIFGKYGEGVSSTAFLYTRF